MPGRYYFKHTVNHIVDNEYRKQEMNQHYREMIIVDSINYLSSTNDNLETKLSYLHNLTHDLFRYGRKNKYDCSLTDNHIRRIIRTIGDDELYLAYFGVSIEKEDRNRVFLVISFFVLLIVFLIILLTSQR